MTGIPPLAIGRARNASVKIPKALSKGEETFALHMKARGLEPVREYEFCPGRKYRADFAFPQNGILIEIEGGTHSSGRHSRAAGFRADCEKHNLAASMGLLVFRFTTEMVSSGEADRQIVDVIGRAG